MPLHNTDNEGSGYAWAGHWQAKQLTGSEVSISRILGNTAHRPHRGDRDADAISFHLAHARTAALCHDARSDTWADGVPGTAQAGQPAVAGNTPAR